MKTIQATRSAIGKAAERADLPPRDHRVLAALLARAGVHGVIPDRKQPASIEKLAAAAHYGYANTQIGIRHLEKHGWVTRAKGDFAGGRFTRYALMIGTDCDCRPLARKPMTDVERARRCRDRKRGVDVDLPPSAVISERTAVYRFFGADGVLLYVGVTNDVGHRWKKHSAEKPWWSDVQRQTVDWYPSRDAALEHEGAAIKAEHPQYNIMHAMTVTIAGRTEAAVTCSACGDLVPVAAAFDGLHAMCEAAARAS